MLDEAENQIGGLEDKVGENTQSKQEKKNFNKMEIV